VALGGPRSIAVILLLGGTSLAAQVADSALQYRPEQLHCSRFFESSESRIMTQSAVCTGRPELPHADPA
jgi:hypothetical protein